MDQSLLLLLILTQKLLRATLNDCDRAMLSRLLELLLLSSLCSAMLRRNRTSLEVEEEEGSTFDPNTYNWPGPEDGDMPRPMDRGGAMMTPWAPEGNMTTDKHRHLLGSHDITPEYDMAVCDMLLNRPVPPTIDQIPFYCLCSTCGGTMGPKGERGDRGPPGSPGSSGIRGMMGFKGRQGFTGSPGMKGQKGDLGEKGQQGPTGFTGMKGDRGYKGEKGTRGTEGPPGSVGPQGETGICPASCQSVQGPPGPQGSTGPAGIRGLPGIQGFKGARGLKGAKGDLGQPGEPGMNGMKGDQGEQGECNCSDGEDGQDGRPGDKGSKGDKGSTGAQGTQGPTGAKGSMGNLGLMGPPGPCSPAIQSAFSASINQSFPRENFPIPFPTVITNRQAHFNPSTGIYTAPVNGTYVFYFHLAVTNRVLKVGLFLNFYPIVKMTEGSGMSTTSQTTILHLCAGDRVWLQVKDGLTNGMYTDSESRSTFSGFLMHPDSCDLLQTRHHHWSHSDETEVVYNGWDGPHDPTPSP